MYFSQENFHGGLRLKHLDNAIIQSLSNIHFENHKKCKSLAQRIFTHLC